MLWFNSIQLFLCTILVEKRRYEELGETIQCLLECRTTYLEHEVCLILSSVGVVISCIFCDPLALISSVHSSIKFNRDTVQYPWRAYVRDSERDLGLPVDLWRSQHPCLVMLMIFGYRDLEWWDIRVNLVVWLLCRF
jgi:hypothetical protein